MKKVISQCPVCVGELSVVRLKCAKCGTVIENDFTLSKFDYLSAEELHFTETFIKCRGNIKEVEKELGISYPTVRAKLDGVIQRLGYEKEAARDEEMLRREAVLRALEQGEISAPGRASIAYALLANWYGSDLPSGPQGTGRN